MLTRRLDLFAFLGLALAVTLTACSSSPAAGNGSGGTTGGGGGGGISGGAGGAAGGGGVSGSGGLQAPRTALWVQADWVGQWPATTNGTTPSQFAGKSLEMVIYQQDVPFTGPQEGWGYKGYFLFDGGADGGAPEGWTVSFQRVGSAGAATASYAWWLYTSTSEQLRVQAYKDDNNQITMSTTSIGARGTTPNKISFDTWSITIGGVTESSGGNPSASLVVLNKQ